MSDTAEITRDLENTTIDRPVDSDQLGDITTLNDESKDESSIKAEEEEQDDRDAAEADGAGTGTQNIKGAAILEEAPEELTQTQNAEELAEDGEDGEDGENHEDDEDDFGAFSDASFDDFEQPQEALVSETTLASIKGSQFPQSVFSDESQLESKIEELVSSAFPESLPTYTIPENTSILNERSQHLLERLIAQLYLKPYNWQKGSLRRQLLVTLGLPDNYDITKKQRKNEFDMDSYLVRKADDFGLNAEEKQKILKESEAQLNDFLENLITEEELTHMDETQLGPIMEKMAKDLEEVEKILSVLEDEKESLIQDNKTFESVVENLVGHTQRLRREETMKALKKEKEKKKLSLFKKKK